MSFMPFGSAEESFITLLQYADVKAIKDYLIKNLAINLHYPMVNLKTPLMAAIDRNDPQILALMLDRISTDLDNTTTQPCGRTVLMYSAYTSRNPEILQVLLRKGADIERTDIRGWTCLYYAIIGERLKNVKFLLEHGASIDARDLQGRTPFMISVYLSNVNVSYYLLNYGADVHARDNTGYNALELTILWCKRQTAMIILEKCNDLISHFKPELKKLAETNMPTVLRCFENRRNLTF